MRKGSPLIDRGEDYHRTIVNLFISAIITKDVKFYDKVIDLMDNIDVTKDVLMDVLSSLAVELIKREEKRK